LYFVMSFFIREDPLTGKKVIISSLRSRRPQLIKGVTKEEPIQCPFCPGNESLTAEPVDLYTEDNKWIVRVVPNKFPAIQGLHDVIIESQHRRYKICCGFQKQRKGSGSFHPTSSFPSTRFTFLSGEISP